MKQHILAIISVSSFVALQAQPLIDYKTQVASLFFKYGCSPCHGGSGGLYVDTYHDLMTTGYNAPVVVAYDSNSYLVLRLKGTIQPRMPLGGAMSNTDIVLIVRWIKEGATATITDVAAAPSAPATFNLEQNFPNPFNPTTTIRFTMSHPAFVVLKVYGTIGNELATLVSQTLPEGIHDVPFSAEGLASGVYFYSIRIGEITQTRKMTVTK